MNFSGEFADKKVTRQIPPPSPPLKRGGTIHSVLFEVKRRNHLSAFSNLKQNTMNYSPLFKGG